MTTPGTTRTVLLIAGMRGNHCRERIAAALGSVAGVSEVDVNYCRAQAIVTHDPLCGSAELVRAVMRIGYDASLTDGKCAGEGREAGQVLNRS